MSGHHADARPDISRQSRDDPAHIDRFEEWVTRANAQLADTDGCLGLDKVRAGDTDTPRYVTLIHFDNQQHLG